jgi:hypothetical protein
MRIGTMALPGTANAADLRELGASSVRVMFRGLLPDGQPDPAAIEAFRTEWMPFVNAGLRLHGLTPFPADLPGADPSAPGWSRTWRRAGAAISEALGDIVDSWQIGNELNIFQFRAPLRTIPEAARWVADIAGGLRETRPGVRLGINTFGVGDTAAELYGIVCDPAASTQLAYAGVDAYPGCWMEGGPQTWRSIIDRTWEIGRGRPIAVCEVGFPSRGELEAPGDLLAYLRGIGYNSIDEVEADRERLIAAAPGPLAAAFAALPTSSWGEDFEDSAGHLLKKWRLSWGGGSHSEEKQARYFSETLEILLSDERIEELVLFLFQDLVTCWSCGQADCPIETSWGFVDLAGRRKPVFRVIQDLVGRKNAAQVA